MTYSPYDRWKLALDAPCDCGEDDCQECNPPEPDYDPPEPSERVIGIFEGP